MLTPLVLIGFLAVALAGCVIWLAFQSSRQKVELEDALRACALLRGAPERLEAALQEAHYGRQKMEGMRGELHRMQEQLALSFAESKKKEDWLDHQEKELEWYKDELSRRPKIERRTYKILTLGISGTGKTALTLKWANPLVDLGALQGTKVECYERTVSHVASADSVVEHVFEIRDWGGEHVVDALQELILDEVHGLLLVVDLASPDGKSVDLGRIEQQLREFQHESLKFFFGPKTLATCQAVVLFINKSDVLSGTPSEVEREACRHYRKLIDDLERYKSQLDVRVLVGSATYGHSTHHLFAHYVGKILPESAYDKQLLQRMKMDPPGDGRTVPLVSGNRIKASTLATLSPTRTVPRAPIGKAPSNQPAREEAADGKRR